MKWCSKINTSVRSRIFLWLWWGEGGEGQVRGGGGGGATEIQKWQEDRLVCFSRVYRRVCECIANFFGRGGVEGERKLFCLGEASPASPLSRLNNDSSSGVGLSCPKCY